jgi:hypothetical protein
MMEITEEVNERQGKSTKSLKEKTLPNVGWCTDAMADLAGRQVTAKSIAG